MSNRYSKESIRKAVETRQKNGSYVFSEETKRKMGGAMRGKKHSPDTIIKMRKSREKQVITPEARIKMSIAKKGDKAPNWKGGITPINQIIRASVEMRLWREAVFKRDNYTCIWCGGKGYLNADHIKRFADYPELRFAIDNGRTLCVPCHKTTDTYGARLNKRK